MHNIQVIQCKYTLKYLEQQDYCWRHSLHYQLHLFSILHASLNPGKLNINDLHNRKAIDTVNASDNLQRWLKSSAWFWQKYNCGQ